MNSRTIRFALIVLLSGLIGYSVGVNKIKFDWSSYQPRLIISNKEPPPSISSLDFSMFWNTLNKLQTQYYDKTAINSQKLLNGAISGMVASLDDPYTVYLPKQQNSDFKNVMAGKFEGIGAELGMKDKQIIIVAPLDGSPAQKAGLKNGDLILKVGDSQTFGWTLAQAVDKIRGPKGSVVTLFVLHEKEKDPKNINITRDTITVKSVTSWVKPIKDIEGIQLNSVLKPLASKKVAYVRISQFGDSTNQEWIDNINKISLAVKSDKSVSGVVLDLRNNPGGYLQQAVFIASEFIKDGTIVIEEDRQEQDVNMNVSRTGLLTDFPLVVLINKGSASASEIVAGALKDHNRAKLVGETSFGKGTIQEAEDLGYGAGIHITIAKWLTPNGIWVHGKGLTPDITIALDAKNQDHDTQLEKAIEVLP
jgi:carboxyl-terminal processing protease